jgi:hypothetical protein
MVEWFPAHVGSGSGILIGMMIPEGKVNVTDYTIEGRTETTCFPLKILGHQI